MRRFCFVGGWSCLRGVVAEKGGPCVYLREGSENRGSEMWFYMGNAVEDSSFPLF